MVALVDTFLCECGAEVQTPGHILKICPHLEEYVDKSGQRHVFCSDSVDLLAIPKK